MILGITGGIGAGKSTVLQLLQGHWNAYLLEADKIAHDLMKPGRAAYFQIVEQFGEEIIGENQQIDRKRLGEIVFSSEEKRQELNRCTHPLVKQEILQRIHQIQSEEKEALIVIEAALLLEEHYDEICDEIWYIYAEESVRRERLKKSRNYSEQKISQIMARQLKEDEFKNRCNRTIDNGKNLEDTLYQLKKALVL